ncbi:MAG: hypothetical protein HY917_05485 [Candidatus Diapherotrites archaeon]|nr:hypothetical protein [Candidatus Diapherotrites archaeon]
MPSLDELQTQIDSIVRRNQAVESDKAWETSLFRRFTLTLFTYLSVAIYFQFIQVPNPWLNAIVPALGFMLSTLTLPFLKEWWVKNRYRK